MGCRSCYIDANEDGRGDLEYDIVSEGRYHYQVKALREEILALPANGRARDRHANKLGMLVGRYMRSAISFMFSLWNHRRIY